MRSTHCGVGDLLADLRASKPTYFTSAQAYLHSHQLACEYLQQRRADARALQKELTFKFNAVGQLACTIYDHHIVVNTDDGSGYIRPRNVPQSMRFHTVDQAIAYVLATNW